MTDQSKEQKPEVKNWLDKLLEKRGIKVQKVEPPKDFIRVMFPVSADNSPWSKKEQPTTLE